MRPFTDALISGIVCFLLVTFCLRFFPVEKKVRMMVCCFFTALPLLFILSFCNSPHDKVALAFSIFLYGAGFFGGIIQLYNLADRGFSLRILIDIYENPSGQMSLDDIMTGYSQGHGIDWMYQKRIQGMVSQGLLLLGDGSVSKTKKGARVASLFRQLRRWYRFPSVSASGHP